MDGAQSWWDSNSWVGVLAVGILAICVLGVSIAAMIYARKGARFMERSNLKLSAKLAYDSETMEEYLEITIFNSSLRDVTLKDFGLRYKDQTVSLINEFSERRLSKSHNVEVLTGSSITYKLNPERVEKFVVSHNFNAQSIDPIYVIAVDSLGRETVAKEASLSRVFSARQRARILLAKRRIHQEKVENYKATHDGNLPMFEGLYAKTHRREVKIPDLIRRSEEFMQSDKTLTSANIDSSSFAPAVSSRQTSTSSSSYSTTGSTAPRHVDTRDLKVTYLNLEPLKSTEEEEEEKKNK